MKNEKLTKYNIIGKPAPRHDAWSKVKGEQLYSDDFSMQGMLYGKVLRSKYPAAVLKSVDTGKAKALPGVYAVLTAADVPKNIDIAKFGQMKDVGGGFEGLYKVLAEGKIRFKGEAIALVAADTPEIAEQACQLIEVDCEIEKGVFDPEEALKPGAYLVSSENDSNLIMQLHIHKGDVDNAFDEADYVLENEFRTGQIDHAYLETEAGIAWVDDNGSIMIRMGTQVLEHYRTIARCLQLPESKVRNMGVMMGGGFGGKEDITLEMYCALLAMYTRKPVKMFWDRAESLECHCKRHNEKLNYKTAVKKDGTILAQKADILLNSGAYTYLTPWVQMYSTLSGPGCYRVPNVDILSRSAFTNTTFNSAFRGFGAVQTNFATEIQMDLIARELGLSPKEIRLKNCLQNGDELATGFIPEGHIALEEIINKVWNKLNETPMPEYDEEGRKIGRGFAIGLMSYGRLCFMHDSSRVGIRLELDGSITLKAGVPDVGAGQASILCQIAAEELGVSMDKVNPYIMDTHLTPLCGTTTATRQLYMSGNACIMAAREIKKTLFLTASEILGYSTEELQLVNGRISVINNPDVGISFTEVIAATSNQGRLLFHEAQFNAPFTDVPDLNNIRGRVHPDYTYTGHGVEIAVDEKTGEYEIRRIVACADVGKAINLNSCEGQMEGGCVQNVGMVTEGIKYVNGNMVTKSFHEYLIPTSVDVPDVELIMLESGGGIGPYGAKGIGEPSCNSIAPAIVNAINNAVGTSIKRQQLSPEVILNAIHGRYDQLEINS